LTQNHRLIAPCQGSSVQAAHLHSDFTSGAKQAAEKTQNEMRKI
jgi:hypothetical protein